MNKKTAFTILLGGLAFIAYAFSLIYFVLYI